MASPTTPTHGKLGALYVLRPNGFSGIGLNDVTWGTGFDGAATAYYEVVIDSELGGTAGVDTFKWRKDGGAWTEDVDISGAAQTLSDTQTITFAATKAHTADDQWIIGNLKAEATTESGTGAQITTAGHRLLNPNSPPTFTDSEGETVLTINYTNGTAVFSGNGTIVTVAGNNGYIPAAALRKAAYLIDWSIDLSVDMADTSSMGNQWKTSLPGQAGGSGSANAYFIASEMLYNCLAESIAAGDKYFLVELFNYDPDQDQTGDHITAWVTFNNFSLSTTIGDVVKESLSYQIEGLISFTANA